MRARLVAFAAAAAILFMFPPQPCLASIEYPKQGNNLSEIELPSALAEDDSFADLPFEQLRQALREEVEQNNQKGFTPRSTERYNLLIR